MQIWRKAQQYAKQGRLPTSRGELATATKRQKQGTKANAHATAHSGLETFVLELILLPVKEVANPIIEDILAEELAPALVDAVVDVRSSLYHKTAPWMKLGQLCTCRRNLLLHVTLQCVCWAIESFLTDSSKIVLCELG